jgi:hypothetical protein
MEHMELHFEQLQIGVTNSSGYPAVQIYNFEVLLFPIEISCLKTTHVSAQKVSSSRASSSAVVRRQLQGSFLKPAACSNTKVNNSCSSCKTVAIRSTISCMSEIECWARPGRARTTGRSATPMTMET